AATGLDLDFLENPRTLTIIPEQLILDRKITDLNEALRVVPGFAEGDGFGGTNNDFYIRGFRRNTVYRNGFRRIGGDSTRINMTNVEFIQVVRGPASITYGQVQPGGLVDYTTKKPLAETRIAGELRYGTYDDRLALADWSQVITDAAAVRLVASSQRANSFRDFTDIERNSFSLSGRLDLTPKTRWDLSYEWQREKRPLDRGTITVPTPSGLRIVNEITDVPIGRRFGEPFEEQDSTFKVYETTITQTFNEQWNAILTAAYEERKADDLQARPLRVLIYSAVAPITDDGFFTGAPVDPKPFYESPADRIFLQRRVDGNRDTDEEAKYLDGMLRGEFNTSSINHRIAFGFNYRDTDGSDIRFDGDTSNGETIPFFNVQQPIYGALPDDVEIAGLQRRPASAEDFGIFFNDYLTLTERLGILVGVRYSETKSDAVVFPGLPLRETEADAWSPQAGISYQISDKIALIASYAKSFEPNPIGRNNEEPQVLDPEEGEQFEVGIKGQWLDGRLESSLVAFQIEKKNVIAGTDVEGNTILADGQTSDGVEFAIVGQPSQGTNITGAYAYLDAKLDDGSRPRNVPKHTFSLYSSYEVQGGTLEGLGGGAGVFYSGNRFGSISGDTWKLGSYVLADASIWYTLAAPELSGRPGTIRLQFAVKNIFDEEYYSASGGDLRIAIGTPRTYIGSISFDL
ncbi:MAG: TonB-dependent siderophore receptor, partial [Pseudomonadota bacterium]